jgi:8-oxo-dGTP pyrophosphatase MutT (NUDIX family)
VALVTEAADPDVVHRMAGRVIVLDADGRVLLLHGFDPARPDEPYWITIGGGAKPGESLAQAAARELQEETGLTAAPEDLGAPVWHQVAEFSFEGRRFRQEQDYFLLVVGDDGTVPEISTDGLEDEEAAFIDGHRWWTAAELETTAETFYPANLVRLMRISPS